MEIQFCEREKMINNNAKKIWENEKNYGNEQFWGINSILPLKIVNI